MPDQNQQVKVPPEGLTIGDRVVRDPDDVEQHVRWRITAKGFNADGDVITDYETGDGTEGRHVFEHGHDWVWVEVRPLAVA